MKNPEIHPSPPTSPTSPTSHLSNTGTERTLAPKLVRLLLARISDGTMVLIEREDGFVDLEINPNLYEPREGMDHEA